MQSERDAPFGPFCVFYFPAFAKTDSRPCVFRPPSMAAGYFLLLVQKKVTKEKTPSRPRSPGVLPGDCASRLRGSPTVRPCTDGELAGILPAIAARLFLRLLAAAERGPGRAKRGSPCRRRQSAAKYPSSSPRKRGPSDFSPPIAEVIAEREGSLPTRINSASDAARSRCTPSAPSV